MLPGDLFVIIGLSIRPELRVALVSGEQLLTGRQFGWGSLLTIRSHHMSKMTNEEEMKWYEQSRKHWRSWGSWFSWGSPVGLGLFFLALAGSLWIISKV